MIVFVVVGQLESRRLLCAMTDNRMQKGGVWSVFLLVRKQVYLFLRTELTTFTYQEGLCEQHLREGHC